MRRNTRKARITPSDIHKARRDLERTYMLVFDMPTWQVVETHCTAVFIIFAMTKSQYIVDDTTMLSS